MVVGLINILTKGEIGPFVFNFLFVFLFVYVTFRLLWLLGKSKSEDINFKLELLTDLSKGLCSLWHRNKYSNKNLKIVYSKRHWNLRKIVAVQVALYIWNEFLDSLCGEHIEDLGPNESNEE